MTTLLMCPPEYFGVSYIINPWMEGNIAGVDHKLAMKQWLGLYNTLFKYADIRLIAPQPSVPDMVFTANAGFFADGRFILSKFKHHERQYEELYFREWARQCGYEVSQANFTFEGAGDALYYRNDFLPILFTGYGHRSDFVSRDQLGLWYDVDAHPLELVDDRFYHLDTCFCPLYNGYLLYNPRAFSVSSRKTIAEVVPANKRIPVNEQDAMLFACNAVNIGKHIVMNDCSNALVGILKDVGFEVHRTPLSEFMKAGGSAKCLTLEVP